MDSSPIPLSLHSPLPCPWHILYNGSGILTHAFNKRVEMVVEHTLKVIRRQESLNLGIGKYRVTGRTKHVFALKALQARDHVDL